MRRATVIVSVVAVAAIHVAAHGQPVAARPSETVTIDAAAPARPFPHYWERMFGSGRAILSLRDGYRRDLRAVRQATDFAYLRFHAIFHDEVGLYDEDGQGTPVYNFSYVDQIYDGLLEAGVRPFVELGFMPSKLAARPALHPFWYHPNVSPPRDWARWGDLITRFASHLVERYGVDEVARWYFEVWNEPNIDFWAGEPKEESYDRLYETTASALKRVTQRLRVGGPATAAASWIPSFLRYTAEHSVPIDFVSTHVYGNDSASQVLGTQEAVPDTEMVGRAARMVRDQVQASRAELPIVWSEYNASYKNEPDVTDAPFMAPWLANTIRQCDGLTDMMSYWTFSDVFEEQGVVKRPFYGGFGLIAAGGIPKAAFNAFALLHRLGDRRIASDSQSALVTRRADGSLVVAVWNLYPPNDRSAAAKTVHLVVRGVPGSARASISRVDSDHGSPLKAYAAMGSPDYPTRDQIAALRRAAELPPPEMRALSADGSLDIALPAQALAVVEIR